MRVNKLTTLAVLLVAAVLQGCAGQAGTQVAGEQPLQVLVPVMYATDRAVRDRSNPDEFYGGERGSMSYGLANIAISTKKQGEAPFADWSRWQAINDKQKNKNELYSVAEMSEPDFFAQLNEAVAASRASSVVVYVHGYSKKFKTVARNLAIGAYAANLDGVPVLYSWPSKGNPAAYKSDVENMEWSGPHLYEFLDALTAQNGIEMVHVLAHSLGNQGFLTALQEISVSRTEDAEWKFGEIILFAPDVDAEEFRAEVLPWLAELGSRVTLYVSGDDVPLQASKRVNGAPRVGDAKEGILIADGIETVDVTPVVSVFIGHSAHRDSPEIQADLHYLINESLGAAERPTLVPVDSATGRYWEAVSFQ